ncbi:hypothetical protein NP233_g2618 [Leucocoprinus birnbaumii]|uniref:Beta-lactamase-related domain-containing protein n=1 Tax=Leucocoprinus birnbaumii TaxID=56174 RepID=A0AAD5YYL7_9AGAR|nr:hypothetical protein NP233_g2618 [Leucocoprinus birnbaumii]
MAMFLGLRDVLVLCLCVVVHLGYRRRQRRHPPLPPSLPQWPIVGNAFQLPPSALHVYYKELGQKLGSKIIHVDVFGNTFIIINDVRIASDLLEKRSAIYSSRPHVPMLDVVGTSAEFFSFLPYSEQWRNQRRMFVQYFSEKNLPRESEKALEMTRKALLPNLYQTPQDFNDHCTGFVGAVAISITYGLPVRRRSDPLVHLSEEAIVKGLSVSASPGYLVNLFPFLKYLPDWTPGAQFKRDARRFRENLDRVMEEPYRAVQRKISEGECTTSFMSATLEASRDNPDFDAQEFQMKKVAAQVFGAAFETTTAALKTFIFSMLTHPKNQRKAQEEIDAVVGKDCLPDFSHREHLPYLNAVLKETFRWNPTVPTGVPHFTTEDDEYAGYHIPKGSMVFPNTYAMLHDEDVFPRPEEFNPDRFIKNGTLVKDLALDPFVVATFGFGRRACPGGHIALSTLYIAAASILSAFDILPEVDENNHPIEAKHEFFATAIVSEPVPFRCRIIPRKGKDIEGLLSGNISLEFVYCLSNLSSGTRDIVAELTTAARGPLALIGDSMVAFTSTITVLGLISLLFLRAESKSNKLITPATDAYINSLLERWNSSGLSIAVVRQDPSAPNGWYHEFGSYGIANAQGDPVTPDTVFAIASNSKLFLACSVGLLIDNSTLQDERGKELKWTTKAKDVYGDIWKLWDEESTGGTSLQDMLSHRTGLPRHDYSGVARKGGVAEMISTLRHLRPSAEFRQSFQYNNLMYESLSYLPPLLLNQTFESYVDEHIFKPLNMTSSTYSVAEAESWGTFADGFQDHLRDLTRGINGTKRATVPYIFRPGQENIWAGAGGVLTSARDLVMWVSMLLNKGNHPYTGQQVIPAHVIEHVATGITVAEGKASYPELSPKVYGAGQFRYSYRGRELIEHGGNNPGYKTQVVRFPNDNLAVVSLSNDANGGWLMESAKWRIIDDVLFRDQEPIDWNTRYEEVWANFTRDAQLLTLRPSQPKPPAFPIHLLAQRTYKHPTYGSLQPCVVPSSLSNQTIEQRDECTSLLDSLSVRRILHETDLTIPTLIIPWKRSFVSHLRLQHFDANLFNVTVIWSNVEIRQKEGYGTRPSDFMNSGIAIQTDQTQATLCTPSDADEDDGDMLINLDEHFEIEWVVDEEEGLAFKGGFWGMEGTDAKEPGGTGKESAEVWFARSA